MQVNLCECCNVNLCENQAVLTNQDKPKILECGNVMIIYICACIPILHGNFIEKKKYCMEISSNVELWQCHDSSYKYAKGEYIDVCIYIIEITTDDKLRRYWHNVTMVALNNIPQSCKYITCT